MATDQEIRDAGFKYIPQQKYLQNPFEIPTAPAPPPPVSGGITNTNAFANSGGGNDFNLSGNAFGYGTPVSPTGNTYFDVVRREGPKSFAAYDKLSQAGATAPAGMFQTDYFPGTENELADAMGRMPGQEGYKPSMDYSEDAFKKAEDKRGFLSRLMNNAKQKMTGLPDWAQSAITAAGMLNPFTAIPKLLGMSTGDGGPSYGIAGLSDAQKQNYDALAAQGYLFDGPGGMKTLTGKNFTGKGYLEGQLELAKKFGFDTMTDQQIADAIKEEEELQLAKGHTSPGFKYKQMLEASEMYKANKGETIKDPSVTTDLVNEFTTTTTNNNNNNDGGSYQDKINEAIKEAAKDPYSGYGSCFIAGTKVTMADGTLKNIEDVVVGDKVKGHKEENTVIKLDPTLLATRKLYSFNNNDHYFFTSEHPFMTEEGWKSIKPEKTKERDGVELYEQLKGELKVGDKLVTDKGSIEIKSIESKEMNNPEMPLYNFNVSNDNSYIADGYVVHNKGGQGGQSHSPGSQENSPGHPSNRADGGLMYANGGRVKFNMGGAQFAAANKGEDISPGTDSGGNFRDGNNNNNNNDNNNQVITNPVDISTVTKSIGDYEIPYGLEALLADKGKFQAVLNADNILDKNLGLDFTYDQGPYQVGFNADMEGNKNLGLSYNKGNLSAYANTDFNDPSVGFKYSKAFAYGGLASIL